MKIYEIDALDRIYKKYDYELKKSSKEFRVYVFKKNMYFGADIIVLSESVNVDDVKKEFSEAGYAVIIRNYKNIEDVENTLFDGFFNTDLNIERNIRRYKYFTDKQSRFLGSGIEYTYIRSPFISDNQDKSGSITEGVLDIIRSKGAHLIIIEAAAGFGKTCTAYELLNEISNKLPSKCTFFAELSRNRENRTFKQVLLTEMDAEFPSMVKSDLVNYHIHTGRIPLIIDGFDELLSKEQWKEHTSNENFVNVETMLTTIGDILIQDAKVILTSRKTAIFSGDDFHKWVENYNGKFKVSRFSIDAPRIQDWLENDKFEILNGTKIPLKHIANPVLLAYLKNLDIQTFSDVIQSTESILDRYFISLLEREQVRQNLLIEPQKQLSIFKKLARLFTEFNITAESKTFVKDLLIEYNPNTLPEIRKNYPSKPTIEELADTLTNHALLDRRDSAGNIGFINDFVFGTLLGQCLCEDTFRIKQKDFPQHSLELAVSSFKYHSEIKRKELWLIIKRSSFKTDNQFKLLLDISLNDYISDKFREEMFDGYAFEDINFDENSEFVMCVFNNCNFINCNFYLEYFNNTSFVNCVFCNCKVSKDAAKDYSKSVYAMDCIDYDSGFLSEFDIYSNSDVEEEINIEKEVLSKLFKVDGKTSRVRQLSILLKDLKVVNAQNIIKELNRLRKLGYLRIEGERVIITQEGILYYHSLN